ncbi:hypothetical protein ANO14919_060730 [Xylariales sp. No.14919]|nr:hypothetical protein ANO14919_060730 [Xylariales sp. No.14919]
MAASTNHWHDPKCPGPKIELEEHEPNCGIRDTCHFLPLFKLVPYCVSCGQRPPLHDILSKHGNSGALSAEPEVKPLGQLNLYWPSTSLYHGSTELATPEKATQEERFSTVYPATLLPDQFRQARLSPAQGGNFKQTLSNAADPEDFPVHLTLEIYHEDNYPEYEAFSYTWEGEDPEDDEVHCPVYVGPYWDILIQTRNCWELLRFARLPHTTRQIWVDAVCINQGNMEEKAQQVAKMGRVFRESLRVVVYLGPGAVVKPQHRFPRRHHFGEFATGAVHPKTLDGSVMDFDIETLFQKRYFTRLWVVQELILSPRTIIRIGDIDISVDSVTTKRLGESVPGWDWAKTPVPWFRYVARQTLGRDPCEALQLVSKANCSDPRDRLFGVLGMMNAKEIIDRGVQADYSVSIQHIWIGFFAHCLLKLEIFWFLPHISEHRKSSGSQVAEPWVPSWVPDWTSPKTWQRFRRPTSSYEEIGDAAYHALIAKHPDLFVEYGFVWLVPNPGAESRILWNREATVNAKTGTLSHVRATRLFVISSTPKHCARFGDYGVYVVTVKMTPGDPDLRLCLVSQRALNRNILPMQDHLYALDTEQGLQFLILRDAEGSLPFVKPHAGPGYFDMGTSRLQNFHLVAAVPYAFLSFSCPANGVIHHVSNRKRWPLGSLPYRLTAGQLIDDIREVLSRAPGDFDFLATGVLPRHFGVMPILPWSGPPPSVSYLDWRLLLPDGRISDLLPVCWELADAILTSKPCSDKKLKKCYLASVKRSLNPRGRNHYLELQLKGNKKKLCPWPNDGFLTWEGKDKGSRWINLQECDMDIRDQLKARRALHIRTPWRRVLACLRRADLVDDIVKYIIWLRSVLDTDDLKVVQDVLAHPTEEKFNYFKVETEDIEMESDGYVSSINIR